jgi:5'-3' exonuclease
MGIKFFYKWLSNYPKNGIVFLRKNEQVNVSIDNLLIDMNGLIHNSAQKIYKYGSCEEKGVIVYVSPENNIKLFQDLCDSVLDLIITTKPSRKIIMNIDGSAPLAKQNQQRQRRYKSAIENAKKINNPTGTLTGSLFDPCSITPGTIFMHELSEYISKWLEKIVKENSLKKDSHFFIGKNIEIHFYDSSIAGEGEHGLLNFIRENIDKTESNCLYANDADLIMLALSLHRDNVFVIRDSMFEKQYKYHLVGINRVREIIIENMKFSENSNENFKKYINDYIFLFFLIGNDFLPNLPAFEINMNGVEILFDIYKKIGKKYGHVIYNTKKGLTIRKQSLRKFLKKFGEMEGDILNKKYQLRHTFFQDTILEESVEKLCIETFDRKMTLMESLVKSTGINTEIYKAKYYDKKFEDPNIKTICMEYFKGLQWTLEYYSKGPTDWRWFYPYNYAPFASDLYKYILSYKKTIFLPTKPIPPFLQLSIVCHKNSYHLLPKPFRDNRNIKEYCPETAYIDLSGKQREWEGLVILPTIDLEKYIDNYNEKIRQVTPAELYLNSFGQGQVFST